MKNINNLLQPMRAAFTAASLVLLTLYPVQSVWADLNVNGTDNGAWNTGGGVTMTYNNTLTDPTSLNGQDGMGGGSSFSMSSGTLTITSPDWGVFFGQNGNNTPPNTSVSMSGGNFTINANGGSEARFAFGNNRATDVSISGGLLTINTSTNGTTDGNAGFFIARDNGGTATVTITGGKITSTASRFGMGGQFTSTAGGFSSKATGVVTFGSGSGVFELTALASLDTTTATGSFVMASGSYFNFLPGSGGQLSVNAADLPTATTFFGGLVSSGNIRVNGSTATMAQFVVSYVGGQGILSTASLLITMPAATPPGPVYAGTPVALSDSPVGATTYQWQTDNGSSGATFSDIGGATSTNYVLDTTSLLGAYQYHFIASGGGNSVTSSPVTLTVVAASAPVLGSNSASPNATTNFVGNTETYTASFTGTLPIRYQWQVSPNADGSAATSLTGQTNTTLVLTNLQYTNSGYYSLQASNNVSPFTNNSPWTQLVVTSPTNAFIVWSSPVPFLGQSAGQMLTNPAGAYLEAEYFGSSIAPLAVTVGGNIFTFKGDGSSASVVGNIGTASGAWLVGTNTTGNANLDTVLNQFVWDGGIHTITLHNLVMGQQYAVQFFALDNRGGNASARLTTFQDPNNGGDISAAYTMGTNAYLIGTFTAPGTDVAIQQNLPTGGGGNINAVVVRALSYLPAVQASILTSPASVTAYVGRTVQFTATVDGVPTPTLNWQEGPVGGPYTNLVNGGQIAGATSSTLTVSNVTLAQSGMEFVLFASNSAGSATSSPADLTVLAVPALSGTYSTNVLALNPVAYWPFNETANPDATANVSTLAAYDASVNQHDGLYLYNCYNAYNGIVGPQSTDGYPQFAAGQGAMSPLNNVANTWVTAPALNLNTNAVTMVMWVNPAGPQTDYTSLLFTYSPGTRSGMGYSSNQRLGYDWNDDDSGTYNYTAGPVIPENMWSMVAVVVTPTNASFYVINTNGVSSTTYVHNHNNMAWNGTETIGSGNNNLSRTFGGVIDEVAVFNYAMTSNQLVNLSSGVMSSPVNTNAATANFNAAVAGAGGSQTMNFTWAPDHLGWQLYTNSVDLTAPGSWFPVPGSGSVTNESISINPAQPKVFFQLRYP